MSIYRCQRCALRFARPVPSAAELEEFYQGFLYRKPSRKKLPRLLRARERELRSLFALSESAEANTGKSFLDHGGGTGAAYAAARRLGLDSWFSDMDRQAIAHVSEEFGLEQSHVVKHIAEHPSRFDYVLSDNVVEHVPEPVALIRELTATLKPGGVLVIKTPHAASTDMYFYPRVWSNYARRVAQFNGWGRAAHMLLREPVWCCDPPRHLYSFTHASLAEMALQAGVALDHFAVETYETPLLKNTYTERVLSRRGLLGRLRSAALLPVLPAEWATKAVQHWSRHAGWLSPGGLVLRVWRAGGASSAA
jgi:2-polyprenyl-3-methyl-5-hydroxy-6-metoxy-1,4-benzoquinol methylase